MIDEIEENFEELLNLLEDNFGDEADFCNKCAAQKYCNGVCCYEQLKETFEKWLA